MRKQKAKPLVRFGENVRALREQKEWTQERLAVQADLDQPYISGIQRGEMAGGSRLSESLRSVVCEKARVGQCCVVGNQKALSGIGAEVFGDRTLRQCFLESRRQHKTEVGVEGDEIAIKRGIMEAGETKPVTHVQPFGGVCAPRQDMRGDQKVSDCEPRHATASGEVVEHGLAEIVLPAAQFHVGERLGRSGWWTFPHSDSFGGQDLEVAFGGGVEEGAQRLFAGGHGLIEVGVELVPDGAIQRARTGEPFDAAQFQGRIERGEVTQLHRYAAGGPAELGGEGDDGGVAVVQLPEGEFVVEVEGNEQLVAGPFLPGCHAPKVGVPKRRVQHGNTSGTPES